MTRRHLVGCGLALLGAGCTAPPPANTAPIRRYQLRGEVVRLVPRLPAAVLKHQEIKGWMEAMTMEFPVRNRQEYERLHVGDHIRATVFVQDLDYWIGEIQPDSFP